MNPNRILIGCAVKENNAEYANIETEYLFRTLDKFGGELTNAKKIACFTIRPDSLIENFLTSFGIEIRINNKLDERQSFANKINILEEGIKEDVDFIVMLDTDVVIARDFSEFLANQKIMIKPEDSDPFTLDEWETLFDYFKINFPNERYFTSCSNQETIPYFNGGVIVIPKVFAKEFLDQWKYFLKKLLDEKMNLPIKFITNSRFFDQIAFSLALMNSKFPYTDLPLSMNYPFSGYVNEKENPEALDPYIIHHHHCILETGDLMHCPYKNINLKIDKINTFLQATCEIKIDKDSLNSNLSIRNLTMINEFEKVIERISDLKIDESSSELQYYLALSLCHTNKNFDEALIRYNKALELGFDPFMIYSDRSNVYHNLGDDINAKSDLLKALSIQPYNLEVKKRLALFDTRLVKIQPLLDDHKFNDVIKNLNSLSLDDENPFLQYSLALSLHHANKNLDEALIRYNKALELGFDPFWVFYNRGFLNIDLKNLKNAKDDFIESQKLSDNFFDILINTIRDKNNNF
jgi:tetratricopeptide (TPR) repeat protein